MNSSLKNSLLLSGLVSLLAACGSTATPSQEEQATTQSSGVTELVARPGMWTYPAEVGEALKSGRAIIKITPIEKGDLKAQALASCNSYSVPGNAGSINIHYDGGLGYYWNISMYQPYLWYSYDYTVTTNGQVYDSRRNWFAQPSGHVTAPSGFVIGIYSTAYSAGFTSYGTLQCRT